MQRLTRLTKVSPRAMQPALAMVKETGTPVDFTQSREIDLQTRTFRDDIFGVYAYQGAPVTVDATTRDTFVNGALADLQTQAAGQGMEIQYIIISWNETAEGSKYYITDLVVGAVAKVIRDFNTGPAYLIDALKAIGWFNQMISKMIMPWNAWLLLVATRTIAYKTCQERLTSDWKSVSGLRTVPLPDLPSAETVKSQLLQEGRFDEGLGAFAIKLLDAGYTITFLGYKVQVCFERGPTFGIGAYYWGYRYRLHVRFSWDFTSDPDFTIVESAALTKLFAITATFIFALIIIVGGLIIAGVAVYNLTHRESSWQEYGPVPVPGTGEWVTDPETGEPVWTGEWEWGVVEEGWESGPPEWWADIIPTVVLGALIIIGAVIVVPPIIRSLRGR